MNNKVELTNVFNRYNFPQAKIVTSYNPAPTQIQTTVQSTIQEEKPTTKLKHKRDIDPKEANDKICESGISTKIGSKFDQAIALPEYVLRGLKGDPECNFFEFLKVAQIPYYIGGPMLVTMYTAALNKYHQKAAEAIIGSAKKVAAGVVLYYLAAAFSKAVIDVPVKLFRGVDLNHLYRKAVKSNVKNEKGEYDARAEYHKVYESADFTRWDLLAKNEQESPDKIKQNFNLLAPKFGIDKEINNDGEAIRTPIKKLIVMATVWKYALTVPFVMLALGLADNKEWETVGNAIKQNIRNAFVMKPSKASLAAKVEESANEMYVTEYEKLIKEGLSEKRAMAKARSIANAFRNTQAIKNSEILKVSGPSIRHRLGQLSNVFMTFVRPIPKSFKALWERNKLGKAIILTSAILPIYANIKILNKTSVKDEKTISATQLNSVNTQGVG